MSLLPDGGSFYAPSRKDPLVDPGTVPEDRRWMIPRYGDPSWSLLAFNNNPSAADEHIWWTKFPEGLCEPFRHAAWALINFPLPAHQLARLGSATRSKLSVARQSRTVLHWARFARWMETCGIAELPTITTEDLTRYSLDLAKDGLSRNTVIQHLVALVRLHLYGSEHLPPEHRLAEPPWLSEGMDDYLPAATPGGENVTEPISPETLGPLLIWALRMVENLAPDVLAARAERARMMNVVEGLAGSSDRGELEQYLRALRGSGSAMPTRVIPGGRTAPAAQYLAAITNTPLPVTYQILRKKEWRDLLRDNPGPSPLDVEIRGRVGDSLWRDSIDFGEVDRLTKRVVDACFMVIAYLTGMRPGEVLGLEYGCCPEPEEAEDGARRHLIWSRQFKNAKDEDGNHLSDGEVRDAPWLAVPQVVRAIRVLEEIVGPDCLLFDALTHDVGSHRQRSGRSMSGTTIANRVEQTVAWFSEVANELGREFEAIPPDPEGRIGTARFRRSLAWHIARRPGGLVALALQYGHMRTIVSEGYASRARGGIHELLDVETARAVAENLSDLHEALQDGEGVSGAAARRTIYAASHQEETFGGVILTLRQAKALLADPTLTVFVNEAAYCLCNYDRSKALCQLGVKDSATNTPALNRCVEGCGNLCRTDSQATQLESDADSLLVQAGSGFVPRPIADRMTEHAQDLHARADRHRHERITVEEIDDDEDQ